MNNQIKFGNRVKDIVTGFEGIVTGEARYMNGCEKWAVDGKFVNNQVECLWIDKQQAVKIDDGIAGDMNTVVPVHSQARPDIAEIISNSINALKVALDDVLETAGPGGPSKTPTRA